MTPQELIGRNLGRIRRDKGYTQEQLEALAEITQPYISGLESGARNPTITVLVRLAHALEVSVGDLIQGVDSTQPGTKTTWPTRLERSSTVTPSTSEDAEAAGTEES